MGLWIHILIVIFRINSFTIKKYIHTAPKGWKLWFGQKYDQKWQKWPKLCSVILHMGCLIDLESFKRFLNVKFFPSGLAWNHPPTQAFIYAKDQLFMFSGQNYFPIYPWSFSDNISPANLLVSNFTTKG